MKPSPAPRRHRRSAACTPLIQGSAGGKRCFGSPARFQILLIIFSLLFSIVAVAASALRGDINGDGFVDGIDLGLIQGYILGKTPLTGNGFINADTNGDGVIDAADLIALNLLPSTLSSSSP